MSDSEQWYTVPNLQELPLCLRVEDASRLFGLDVGTAYRLARTVWKPFIKQADRLLLVKTAGLLRWLDTDDNGQTQKEK